MGPVGAVVVVVGAVVVVGPPPPPAQAPLVTVNCWLAPVPEKTTQAEVPLVASYSNPVAVEI